MGDFSQQFEIIYEKFSRWAKSDNRPSSKLAFSRYLDISQGRMQKWEAGQIPRPADLKIIHDKLGFSYSWLVTGEGEPDAEASAPSHASADDVMTLKRRITELEAELKEERALNRRLTERLLETGTNGEQRGKE